MTGAILSFDVGIVNLAYCLIRFPAAAAEVIEWDIICLAEEGEKAKKIPLGKLGRRLFARLDAIWEAHGPEVIQTVLIENQPSRLNGHMKSIQMMIYSYFLYKGAEALLVNACGKLKTHDAGMTALTGGSAENTPGIVCPYEDSYRKNKWWSVQLTGYYVREDEALAAMLKSHKKKDDLCDALLQAIGWFQKTHKKAPAIERVVRV